MQIANAEFECKLWLGKMKYSKFHPLPSAVKISDMHKLMNLTERTMMSQRACFHWYCSIVFAFFSITTTLAAASERIVLVAGGTKDAVDIPAVYAILREPFGTAFDSSNQLWIVEMVSGNRLLKIDSNGMIKHVAGKRESGFSGDGGPAIDAQFNGPHNFAIQPDDAILIGDTWNGKIRKMDPISGRIDSIKGFDVSIDKAKGAGPYCITIDFEGKYLYIADLQRIHKLELSTGNAVVIAGNGKKGVPQDGALAIETPLSDPRAVAPDRLGNIYILERGGNALRVVKPDGTIQTVVRPTPKNEAAKDIDLNGPKHLCIDKMNRVVIADAENHLIRRFDPSDGSLRRIAGTGKKGKEGVGGSPLECQLARPHGVTIHPVTGELYITDSYNNRILRIVE